MSWVCSCCSNNNEDGDSTCLLCGSARPAQSSSAGESVCTLTQRRATEICAYADVTIPAEFNVIGENAFKGRTDLISVRIHSGVKKIMKSAFEGCTNLSRVYCDGSLGSIGARAFANCKYLSPDKRPTAERVAADAFEGCSDTAIEPPSRVVSSRPPASSRPSLSSTPRDTSLRTPSGSTPSRDTSLKTPSGSTRPYSTGSSTSSSGSSAYRPSTPPRPASTGSTSSPRPSTTSATPTYTPVYKPKYVPDAVKYLIPMLACVLALGFGLFFFCEADGVILWEDWSYMIALTLALGVCIVVHWLISNSESLAIALVGTGATVLSAILWWLCPSCLPIVTVLTLASAFLGVVNACIHFGDDEPGFGWWNVAIAVLNQALLIYTMVKFGDYTDWRLWQCLIAVALSLALGLCTHIVLNDGYSYEVGIAVQVIGFVITGILLWSCGTTCSLMVTVLCAAMAIAGVVSAVTCIKDDEGGFGAAHIVFSVLNVGILVLNNSLII